MLCFQNEQRPTVFTMMREMLLVDISLLTRQEENRCTLYTKTCTEVSFKVEHKDAF